MAQPARRVLVLGATGHIGAQFAAACRRRGLEVVGLSRRGGDSTKAADLTQPEALEQLEGFDVVINATDTSRVPPAPLAAHCLRNGAIFIETSADPAVFRELASMTGGSGSIVLGAGAFPGLSTYLLEAAPPNPTSLEFVASWSVMSGAGAGTVEVMLDGLRKPALVVRDGRYAEMPPLGELRAFSIAGRRRWAIPLGVPDVVLAHQAARPGEVTFWAAVRPALPRVALRIAGRLAANGWFERPWIARATRAWLGLLRRVVLARRTTSIDIELHADGRRVASVFAADAFEAGARSVAILAERWPSTVTGAALPQRGVPLDIMRAELGSAVVFSATGARANGGSP